MFDVQKIIESINRPFTLLDDYPSRYALILLSSIFATLFIVIYDPMHITSIAINNKIGNLLSIYSAGVVGGATLILTQIVLRRIMRIESFRNGTYLLWTLFEFCSIAFVIFLIYGERGLPFWEELRVTSRLAIFMTLLPYASACLVIAVFKAQKEHRQSPISIMNNTSPPLIDFANENDKSVLMLRAADILYLKANDNYVEIYFEEHGALSKKLIRNRLKNIEHSISHEDLIRVHRSYIINRQRIKSIHKKGIKLIVQLEGIKDQEFLVTPTYQHRFQTNTALLYSA